MSIKKMDLDEFLEFLKEKQGDQSDRQFAISLGVSPAYLSLVYNGLRDPGESITSALNVERSTVYSVPTPTKRKEEK